LPALKTATTAEFRDAIRPSIAATVPMDDASEYDGTTPVSPPQNVRVKQDFVRVRLDAATTGVMERGHYVLVARRTQAIWRGIARAIRSEEQKSV
jgi:hypothetical protein